MLDLTFASYCGFIDKAAHIAHRLDAGGLLVLIGVADDGREFITVQDALTGRAKLGYL